VRQWRPRGAVERWQRPCELLAHGAFGVEHLIAKTILIERRLHAMQILDAFGHPVRGARARRADLQHAAMDLNIECEDVAAQIGGHAG